MSYSCTVENPSAMTPILFVPGSVNAIVSRDAAIPTGYADALGIGYSVRLYAVVRRPILLLLYSVNQSARSEPVTMPSGQTGTGGNVSMMYSYNAPKASIRPMRPPLNSVNHTAPSGPIVIPLG